MAPYTFVQDPSLAMICCGVTLPEQFVESGYERMTANLAASATFEKEAVAKTAERRITAVRMMEEEEKNCGDRDEERASRDSKANDLRFVREGGSPRTHAVHSGAH